MRLHCLLALSLLAPLAAQAAYETGFEGLTASPAGVAMLGQDGFFIGPVAGSLDQSAFTYAGNALLVPPNPNGGNIFMGSVAIGTGATPARSQRVVPISTMCRLRVDFDVLVNYNGAVGLANQNIGSVSLQPSGTCRHFILLARWTAPATPTTWNADFVVGPTAAGAQTTFPDPNFLNLPVGVWHRWGCTVDLNTAEYTEFRITNGATNVTTTFVPAPAAMPMVNPTGVIPTDVRFFTGGPAGNVLVFDNFTIAPEGDYLPFGTGCPGPSGIPTLAKAPGSRPRLGSTFQARLSNMPGALGVFVTGFNNTSWQLGPLPYSLNQFGLTGCSLLVEPLVSEFVVGTAGTATWNLVLNNNINLLGTPFFQQGFAHSPGTNPIGFIVSNGASACVGR